MANSDKSHMKTLKDNLHINYLIRILHIIYKKNMEM